MKGSSKTLSSIILILFMVIGTMGSGITNDGQSGPIHIQDKTDPAASNSSDVAEIPTLQKNSSWEYHHEYWTNQTNNSEYMHVVEMMNYTVSEIGYYTYNGTEYYCFNLSIEIDVIEGDGYMDGYSIDITGGSGHGYVWKKVSDLGMVKKYEYRHLEGTAESFYPLDIRSNTTQANQPVVEAYDYPIKLGEKFWSNTTVISSQHHKYDAGTLASGQEWSNSTSNTTQVNEVASSKADVTVPAGTYSSVYLNRTATGNDTLGFRDRWYNSSVRSFVKEYGDTLSGNSSYDWRKKLNSYDLVNDQNKFEITPEEERMGNDVNLSGSFPNYPDQQVTVEIPEGTEPTSVWNTTTDSDGNFSLQITVPLAEDNTDTLIDWSSNGFVASVDSAPKDAYAVSTLTIQPQLKELQLQKGWRFISTPLKPIDDDISSILDKQSYGIRGSYDKVLYFNRSQNEWRSYMPNRSSRFDSLERVNETMGFWIHMTADDTLGIEGIPVFQQNITLHPGWNMVGSAVDKDIKANSTLPSEVTKVGVFNSSREYDLEYVTDLSELIMKPDSGYMIYNAASYDVVWQVN